MASYTMLAAAQQKYRHLIQAGINTHNKQHSKICLIDAYRNTHVYIHVVDRDVDGVILGRSKKYAQ